MRKRRCVDDIQLDIKETEWKVVDWIQLARDSTQCLDVFNTAANIQVR